MSNKTRSLLSAPIEVWGMLDARQRNHFLILQLVMVVASFVELLGVVSVAPFMAIATNPEVIETNQYLKAVNEFLGVLSSKDFLFITGLFFVFVIVVGSLVQIANLYLLNRFSIRLGAEISSKLHRRYLQQSVEFFSSNNTASLTNNVTQQTDRVAQLFLVSVLRLIAKGFTILVLVLFLMIVDPVVAISSFLVLAISYLFILSISKAIVYRNGKTIGELNAKRIKTLRESYDSIRELKLAAKLEKFGDRFAQHTKRYGSAVANNLIIGQAPYYLMEMVAFSGVVVLALVMMGKGEVSESMTMLALFAMVGYKLLPAFQQCFNAVSLMRGSMDAISCVLDDIKNLPEPEELHVINSVVRQPDHHYGVVAENIEFNYKSADHPVISGVSLEIPENAIIGIIGKSGSGKTTFLDLILGFIKPNSGEIRVGESKLDDKTIDMWHQIVGYVPQSIQLLDATIAENVAFGVAENLIDRDKLAKALELAQLSDWVAAKPLKEKSQIGERGSIISGGEKQRIGIARALYKEPKVLILDEATSALDPGVEAEVMATIYKMARTMSLLIVTHNKSILSNADLIYELVGGRLVRAED